METSENNPPRFFLKLFRWFCHPDFREEIEGDLYECYQNYAEQYGKEKAKWFFIKEVFLLFRPTLIGNIHKLTNLNSTVMITKNRRLIGIMGAITVLLFIPLIAMQFSKEVNWNFLDFVVMGALLLATGLLCELVLRKVKTTKNRMLLCGAALFIFLLIWVELAVGIFGTPFAGH